MSYTTLVLAVGAVAVPSANLGSLVSGPSTVSFLGGVDTVTLAAIWLALAICNGLTLDKSTLAALACAMIPAEGAAN